MRIAYFDCFSGISGDMILGALLDAGLSLDDLRAELDKLPAKGYTIDAQKVTRQGLAGTHINVLDHSASRSDAGNGHGSNPRVTAESRTASDLADIIAASSLDNRVKLKALSTMKLLVEAEARVHDRDPNALHLHELSGLDTLVDIVGAISGLWLLGIERVVCSPLNVGGGYVKTAHGVLPVPAPATAEILRAASVPFYGSDANRELVTPTGAAIIVAIASAFGPIPPVTIDKLGYGAGKADIPGRPNLLRVVLGDLQAQHMPPVLQPKTPRGHSPSPDEEIVTLIESNLDDMNPEYYDFIMEKLLGQGALEVFLVPVQMKKNRPGVVLSVLCRPEQVDELANLIFEETTTLGLRITDVPRRVLRRDVVPVQTPFGIIRIKVSRNAEGKVLHIKPEYDDVKKIALEKNLPIDKVYEEARQAWSPQLLDGHQHIGRQRNTSRSFEF